MLAYIGLCLLLQGLENIYVYMGFGFMLVVLSILFFFEKHNMSALQSLHY